MGNLRLKRRHGRLWCGKCSKLRGITLWVDYGEYERFWRDVAADKVQPPARITQGFVWEKPRRWKDGKLYPVNDWQPRSICSFPLCFWIAHLPAIARRFPVSRYDLAKAVERGNPIVKTGRTYELRIS